MKFIPILLSLLSVVLAETTQPNTGPQPQGFLFGFNPSSLILPVVYTCPTPLYLSAATSLNYGGPDAQGPYSVVFMVHEQLIDDNDNQYDRWYSHTEVVPDMNNARYLNIPWMNGTQFIACVWAQNGVSGGCQDLFTVVPSEDQTSSAFANSTSACRANGVQESWATPYNRTLDVELVGTAGTLSPNSWPPSCSDISFRPKNGTGPYTTVIAPVQHPPINISSSASADNSMNYTVRLTHGQAFMASVYDSAGNSFTVGPMHAGNSNNLACLATKTGQAAPPPKITAGALGGGIAGSFIAGLLIAGGIFFYLDKKRKHRERLAARRETLDLYAEPRPANFDGVESKPHNGMITPFEENPHPTRLGYAAPMINTDISPSMRGEDSQVSPSSYRSRDQYEGGLGMARSPTGLSGHSQSLSAHHPAHQHQHQHQHHRVNSPPLNERTTSSFGADTHSQLGESVHRPTSAQSSDAAALASRNLYVVHSDGGQDYHIQLPGGHGRESMNIIELPPGYSPGGSSSDAQQQQQQQQSARSLPEAPAGNGGGGLSPPPRGPGGRAETEKERLIRMSREQGGSPQP